MLRFMFLAAALLTPSLLLAAPAHAEVEAAVVKAPHPIEVDGDPADWGFVTATQGIRLPDGEPAAALRLAYDDTYLYALFEVIDDSPLKNSATVREELLKGGDAVGLAFEATRGDKSTQRVLAARVDGEDVVIALRPEWHEKRPHTFTSPVGVRTMDYVGPIPGAKVATRETVGGYVVELALPWEAMRLPQRSTTAFDAQVIYSDPAGTSNAATAWWHTAGGDAMTVEDLPTEAGLYPEQWGEARLFDEDPGPLHGGGADIRPRPAGVPITFDLPRDAKVSLVVTDGDGFVLRELLRAEAKPAGPHTVEWDGRDRYGEVLAAGAYRWKLAYFDGMGSRFMGSVGNSARPPYRTEDGRGSMGGQHGGASVVAAGPHGIYLMGGTEEGHPAMRAIDPDGRTLWKRSMGGWGKGVAAATDGDDLYLVQVQKRKAATLIRVDAATGRDLPLGGDKRGVELGDEAMGNGITGMAAADGKLFIARGDVNQLVTLDAETGKTLDTMEVDAPRGLATLDRDTLLFITGDEIRRLDLGSGRSEAFIDGLVEPAAPAVDDGQNVYVAQRGDRQMVSRFDRRGRFLGTLGKPGGRLLTQVPYNPDTLRHPRALAVGPNGNLWVVEDSALRRVATFTPNGRHVADQFGPTAYNTVGPDLDDLSTVFYQPTPNNPLFAEVAVDYDAYANDPESPMAAWSVKSLLYMSPSGEAPAGVPTDDEVKQTADAEGNIAELIRQSMMKGYGHVVAFTGDNGTRYLWRIAKKNRATYPAGAALWREAEGRWLAAAFVSNDPAGGRSWSDTNGDGVVQPDEAYPPPPTENFAWLTRGLTLYGEGGTLAPSRIDTRGVPFYDGGTYTPHLDPGEHEFPRGWIFNSMPDADGAVYFAGNIGPHRHLSFWDRASENRVMRVLDGRVQWIVGQHTPHPRQDSDLTTVSGVSGVVDGIVLVHIVEPGHYVAYTTDGLTLGNVIVDQYGNPPDTGPLKIYIESFTGLFVKDPDTGRRVLFSVRSGDDPILEITGPGDLQRLEGTVQLDTARPRLLMAGGQATVPYETWWGNSGANEYEVDGLTWEWLPNPSGLPIESGGELVGDVRLRRDAGSLFVLANAVSPGFDGAASDDQPTGSAAWGQTPGVELMLAPPDGRPGDATRLFLTATAEGPVALQWTGDGQSFKPIPDAQVALIPRWHGLGWRLEAELPLASLPDALSQTVPQVFRRLDPDKKNGIAAREADLPDLIGTLRLNAALHLRRGNTVQRLPWIEDGTTLDRPGRMSPETWGSADAPR